MEKQKRIKSDEKIVFPWVEIKTEGFEKAHEALCKSLSNLKEAQMAVQDWDALAICLANPSEWQALAEHIESSTAETKILEPFTIVEFREARAVRNSKIAENSRNKGGYFENIR